MHPSTRRLYDAAKELRCKEGQSEVARLLNEAPQTLNNWETRGISKAGAIKAQAIIGCSALWLSTGAGPMRPGGDSPAAAPQPPTIADTLDSLGALLLQASPQTRAAVAGLLGRYAEEPATGQSIAKAIELLLSADTHDKP